MSASLSSQLRPDGIYAVIPIKDIRDAKQRLSGCMDVNARREFFKAMVEDVLAAVSGCDALDGFVIVTDDVAVSRLGERYGALIMPEPAERGLIPAVTEAARLLAGVGARGMVFLPADIPLVTPGEIKTVVLSLTQGSGPQMIIAPAADFGGSNCLATSPPDCMPFAFGEDSYRKHVKIARDLGMEPVTVVLAGAGLDIDVPADVEELVRRTAPVATAGAAASASTVAPAVRRAGIGDDLAAKVGFGKSDIAGSSGTSTVRYLRASGTIDRLTKRPGPDTNAGEATTVSGNNS